MLYYGDEIGMGDNIQLEDRNGVRTPMQWTNSINSGFSQAPADKLIFPIIEDSIFGYQHVNVTKQIQNENSIYHFIRKLIGLRKELPFLGYGELIIIRTSNPHILCYLRTNHEMSLLILHNFSLKDQICSVDLSEYPFLSFADVFNQQEFPNGTSKVTIDLKPYQFLWIKSH